MSFEKVAVYQVAVQLRATVMRAIAARGRRDLRDRFGKASSGVIFYLREGVGWSEPADRRRFHVMARGSALEAVEALALLRANAALTAGQYAEAKQLAIRVMAMLANLARPAVLEAEVGR